MNLIYFVVFLYCGFFFSHLIALCFSILYFIINYMFLFNSLVICLCNFLFLHFCSCGSKCSLSYIFMHLKFLPFVSPFTSFFVVCGFFFFSIMSSIDGTSLKKKCS